MTDYDNYHDQQVYQCPIELLQLSSSYTRQAVNWDKVHSLIGAFREKALIAALKVIIEPNSCSANQIKYGIIDGYHRYLAARATNLTDLAVVLLDLTASQAIVTSYRANQTSSYSLAERVTVCVRLADLGLSTSDIVKQTGLTTADKFIKLSRGLSKTALEYYVNQGMSQAAALVLVELPMEKQDDIIKIVTSGGSNASGMIDKPTVLKVMAKTDLITSGNCSGTEQTQPSKVKSSNAVKTAVKPAISLQDSLKIPIPTAVPATTTKSVAKLPLPINQLELKLTGLQLSDGQQTYQVNWMT